MNKPIKKEIDSFRAAGRGLFRFFREGNHARFHLFVAVMVMIAGYLVGLAPWEWAAILFCIALVIGLELINTALERLCDFVHPEIDPEIGYIKDLAAAAVLVGSLISMIIGLVIFLPYLCPGN